MGFKKGDCIIYIGQVGTSNEYNILKFGFIYTVTGVKYVSNKNYNLLFLQRSEVDDTFFYYFNHFGFRSDRFIHENDWVKRMRYGV